MQPDNEPKGYRENGLPNVANSRNEKLCRRVWARLNPPAESDSSRFHRLLTEAGVIKPADARIYTGKKRELFNSNDISHLSVRFKRAVQSIIDIHDKGYINWLEAVRRTLIAFRAENSLRRADESGVQGPSIPGKLDAKYEDTVGLD